MKRSTRSTASTTRNVVNRILASETVPLTISIVVGQPFWLQLSAINAQKLFLINSTLQYDAERLEVLTSEGLPIWESGALFGANPEVDVSFRNDDPGLLAIGVSPANDDSPGVDGSGEFLRIKMNSKLSGATTITWLPDSGAYTTDAILELRRIDAVFNPLALQIKGLADGLVINLNVLPA